ncbi:MFS general substrate transporter [Phanerochaete sordida]|uniref:MFS general substrate transporter n=1 Tax=Phanerochaete sordida TaxID=48140 RepID=A0A9P3LLJ0_9APHY|nr:MFS general substrate transporter [Phanerochaete sordida]
MTYTHPPALFSAVRIATLFTSLLVSLGSGTNYVFSAYGPQLSARLHLSHTQMNIVGLSGNIGVYGTAPVWGWIVDHKGPRSLLALAFVTLLVGYTGIRHFFDEGLPADAKDISTLTFLTLVLCSFLTGIGGNGGLTSSINSTAKSFPDHLRATVVGLVISGFGLSAFLFSTIAHVIFPGNTSEFLLVLAIGTSLPMVLGFFFVRPIPLPHSEYGRLGEAPEVIVDEDEFSSESPAVFHREHNNSHTHLLGGHASDEDGFLDEDHLDPSFERRHEQQTTDYVVPPSRGALALSPTRPDSSRHRSRGSMTARSRPDFEDKLLDGAPNIRGKALASSGNFWLLFVMCSLLSGTGLMYINNVGSISQALFAKGNPDFDDRKAAQWQATQVSTVSVMNCLGRIIIGMIADSTKNHLRLPRSLCICLVAAGFIVSQLYVHAVEDVSDLWKGSALLGLAYGGLFGLFPTITIEWFGLPHFSENWGFVSLAPMLGGNIFSLMFGRNLDAHAPAEPAGDATAALANATAAALLAVRADTGAPSDSSHQCLQGRECYAGSLMFTTAACTLALALSVYAGWRDWRNDRRRELLLRARHAQVHAPEVMWDAPEDE